MIYAGTNTAPDDEVTELVVPGKGSLPANDVTVTRRLVLIHSAWVVGVGGLLLPLTGEDGVES